MRPEVFHRYVMVAAAELLPSHFQTIEAQAMLLAIGMQESDFLHRRQLIGNHRNWWESLKGPASGYFQFEKGGIRGVLEHPASRAHAYNLLTMLGYPPDNVSTIHRAVVHNDLLASAIARLALWRLPQSLPDQGEHQEGWDQYVQVWRPGKPKPDRWPERYDRAWEIVLSS